MDFQLDATADGRTLNVLNVINEQNRLCLTIRLGRRCRTKDVVAVREELTSHFRKGHSSGSTTGQKPSPRPSGTGANPVTPTAWPTSRQDPRGRTPSRIHSMADFGMSSSTPSCSQRHPRINSWVFADHCRTKYIQAAIGPPGAYAPGGSATGSCNVTTTHLSHKALTDKGGHVTGVPRRATPDGSSGIRRSRDAPGTLPWSQR